MSLSLNNDGRPVCLIEDGKQAGRMIFLSDDSKGFSRIKDNGRFVQLPNTKTRDICFISGAAGSGKSYYAAKYIETFSWVFPNGAIYVFSKIKNDPTFSNIAKMPNVTFVTLDDDFAKTPWEAGILEKLAGSLLVFDDIAKLAPLVLIKVMRLLDEAMHDGRHNNIYIIVTSHMITDYKATRSILNEATSVTFFPMVNQKQTENFLKSYGGFLTKQIREVKALDTRSCTFFKGYPTIILYDHGVYLPNAIVKN